MFCHIICRSQNVARLVISYDTIIIAFVGWVSQITNAKYNWRVLSAKFINGFHGYHSHHWNKCRYNEAPYAITPLMWIQTCLKLVANMISNFFAYCKVGWTHYGNSSLPNWNWKENFLLLECPHHFWDVIFKLKILIN